VIVIFDPTNGVNVCTQPVEVFLILFNVIVGLPVASVEVVIDTDVGPVPVNVDWAKPDTV
jgi:hypothetical protein